MQRIYVTPYKPAERLDIYKLVAGVIMRWNSFDLSIERALYLRPAMDAYRAEIEEEYDLKVARARRSGTAEEDLPRPPLIVRDALSDDDWTIIARYHEILKPLQEATKLLQGEIGSQFGCI